jgi:hypothetical protein
MTREDILKDYPHSTKIKASYQVVTPKEHDKHLALASIDTLAPLLNIPKEQIENNPDLLYIASDLWVGGMANKNDDAITKEDTIELAKQIPNKYLNLEHEEEIIVGCLINYGFREYTTERNFVATEEAEDFENPLVASGGGFVWKSVYPKLSDFLIKASDKNSSSFGDASFSWEVFFKDYVIMEGSKFVEEAIIIDDPEEIEKRKPFLKAYDGSGEYEGKRIYRLVKGPKLFLGAGIVKNPAADVKGILTAETKLENDEVAETEDEKTNASENGLVKLAKKEVKLFNKKILVSKQKPIKISQNKKNNVTNNTAMKIKNIQDYTRVFASISQNDEVNPKTLAALEAFDLEAEFEKAQASAIGDAIREESAKFAQEKEEIESAKIKAEEDKAKVEKELSDLQEKSKAADEELTELKNKLASEEQARVFGERMEALNKDYDLDEDDSKVVAKQIKKLDEEAYASWLEDFKVFAKEKSKEYKKNAEEMKKEKAKCDESKAKASADDDSEVDAKQKEESKDAIEKAKASAEEKVPSSQHEEKTNLTEIFKDLELELEETTK